MKNKSLIPNIAVLLVVALVCVLTGQIYLQQQKDDVLYTCLLYTSDAADE